MESSKDSNMTQLFPPSSLNNNTHFTNASLDYSSRTNILFGTSLAIPYNVLVCVVLAYILLIFVASCGSCLVISVVLLARKLRTHSNLYLVNLAVSDLLLVLLACPLTLLQVATTSWPLPSVPLLCQLATFLPLLFSFTSTFSICLIALDRHHLIVYTSNRKHKTVLTGVCLLSVWVLAFLCSSLVLPNTSLRIVQLSSDIYYILGIKERAYCMEDWGYTHGR